jgi:hypothetical protein
MTRRSASKGEQDEKKVKKRKKRPSGNRYLSATMPPNGPNTPASTGRTNRATTVEWAAGPALKPTRAAR